MTRNAKVDLDRIHELYKEVKKEYSQYGERVFLAMGLYLDHDLDLEIALKFRSYGGLIEIDNSS